MLLRLIKKLLAKFGDIHLKDGTVVRQNLLFYACDLGISNDGDGEKMDKDIYNLLLDASSCVNPVQLTGQENTDKKIEEEDEMTLFQYCYTKKNIVLMVQLLSREEFEAKELGYAKNIDFLFNLVNGFVTEEAISVIEYLGNKIAPANPMLSFRRAGYTPVLKFMVDMFTQQSTSLRKLRNNPELVLKILKALEKIGADVSAVFHNEELL